MTHPRQDATWEQSLNMIFEDASRGLLQDEQQLRRTSNDDEDDPLYPSVNDADSEYDEVEPVDSNSSLASSSCQSRSEYADDDPKNIHHAASRTLFQMQSILGAKQDKVQPMSDLELLLQARRKIELMLSVSSSASGSMDFQAGIPNNSGYLIPKVFLEAEEDSVTDQLNRRPPPRRILRRKVNHLRNRPHHQPFRWRRQSLSSSQDNIFGSNSSLSPGFHLRNNSASSWKGQQQSRGPPPMHRQHTVQFQNVFSAAPCALSVIRADGRFVQCNRAWEALCGSTAALESVSSSDSSYSEPSHMILAPRNSLDSSDGGSAAASRAAALLIPATPTSPSLLPASSPMSRFMIPQHHSLVKHAKGPVAVSRQVDESKHSSGCSSGSNSAGGIRGPLSTIWEIVTNAMEKREIERALGEMLDGRRTAPFKASVICSHPSDYQYRIQLKIVPLWKNGQVDADSESKMFANEKPLIPGEDQLRANHLASSLSLPSQQQQQQETRRPRRFLCTAVPEYRARSKSR